MVTAYEIITVPGVTPVTRPAVTVAFAFPGVQTPPVTASVSVMLPPTLTLAGPPIVPAEVVLTVTTVVALDVPQLLVTE